MLRIGVDEVSRLRQENSELKAEVESYKKIVSELRNALEENKRREAALNETLDVIRDMAEKRFLHKSTQDLSTAENDQDAEKRSYRQIVSKGKDCRLICLALSYPSGFRRSCRRCSESFEKGHEQKKDHRIRRGLLNSLSMTLSCQW